MPVRIRLTQKFAEMINGVDLSQARAGEEMLLSWRHAALLIAEGWAAPVAEADDQQGRRRRGRKKQIELS